MRRSSAPSPPCLEKGPGPTQGSLAPPPHLIGPPAQRPASSPPPLPPHQPLHSLPPPPSPHLHPVSPSLAVYQQLPHEQPQHPMLLALVLQEAPPPSLKAQRVIGAYLWWVLLQQQQVQTGSVTGCHHPPMACEKTELCYLSPSWPRLDWCVLLPGGGPPAEGREEVEYGGSRRGVRQFCEGGRPPENQL